MLSEQEKSSLRVTQENLQETGLFRLNNVISFLGELISKTREELRGVKGTADAAIPWDYGSPAQAGKHVDRLKIHPEDMGEGFLFYEDDRDSLYQVQYVFPGRLDIVWIGGMMRGLQAQLPTDLQSKDAGFLYEVTDFRHVLRWTGSGWSWGPGELGSGYLQWFHGAPAPATGWALCDGSAVTALNANGTTSLVTTPDLAAMQAFMKIGGAYDGIKHDAEMPEIWGVSAGRTDDNTENTTVSFVVNPGTEDPITLGPIGVAAADHDHEAENRQPADTHPIPWFWMPAPYYRL
jgi:hypothetical protein